MVRTLAMLIFDAWRQTFIAEAFEDGSLARHSREIGRIERTLFTHRPHRGLRLEQCTPAPRRHAQAAASAAIVLAA
jgi:hypothetical protein